VQTVCVCVCLCAVLKESASSKVCQSQLHHAFDDSPLYTIRL